MHPTNAQRRQAGFTLLELLAVIGVISVLMGIGLGYLGKADPEMVARSILGGERRAAQMTARADGVPTEVVVTPGPEGEPATVQSRLLEAVCSFHFEPGTPVLDERLRPVLGGADEPAGRFGHARRPMPDDKGALLHWPVARQLADLRDGFLLRCDLFLERRDSGVVADMAPMLELRLDRDLRPQVRCRLDGVGGEGVRVQLDCPQALPLRRWTSIEVGCDGREAWVKVDGREFGRTKAAGAPKQEDDMVLQVSPPNAQLPGLVDEVRLYAFRYAPAQTLPIELQPTRTYRFTYDDRGEPVDVPEIEYEALEDGE